MSIFDLFDFAKDLVSRMGYLGVFLGTFLEGIFPPIPSEVIMGFSGFLISEGRFQLVPVLLAAVLGNIFSVSLIWYLGRRYGEAFMLKFGHYVGVTEKEIKYGEKLFQKYGYNTVFICQMIPLARTLIAFPAGILKTNYQKFIIYNTAGATLWLAFLLYLGYTFGQNWDQVENFLKPYERLILSISVIIFIYFAYKIATKLWENYLTSKTNS